MKGISPLIASVLLIAITMTLAAILASFVSSYTRQQLTALPSCVGGMIGFSTANYPKWTDADKTITAVIEADNVDLSDFSFDILLTNSSVISKADTLLGATVAIKSGSSGTIKTANTGLIKTEIDKVRVIAGNCPSVRTSWTSLK